MKDVDNQVSLGAADDLWTRRARPSFLYLMYGLLACALPIGMVALVDPAAAARVSGAMAAYLSGLPDTLYTLFGTGYLGYTAARAWGKSRHRERD